MVKSRENLKQFLVTGQVSIQTLAALGLDTSLNINPDNNLLLNNMLYTGHLDFSPINTNNLETSPINSYFLKSKQFHDENNSVISNNKRETQSYIGFTQNDYSNTELNIQSPFFNQNLTINKKNEVIQRNLPEKTTNLTIDQQKKSSGNKFINNSTGNLKPYNDITTFKQLLTPEETQKIKINNKPIMPFINSEGLAFNKYIQSARVKTEPSQDQLNNLDNRKINVEPFQLDNSLDLDKTCLPSNQNSGFLHASLSKKIQDRINIPNSNLKIEEFNKNVRSIPSKSVIYESSQLGKMIYNLSSTLKQKNNNQNNRNLFKKK